MDITGDVVVAAAPGGTPAATTSTTATKRQPPLPSHTPSASASAGTTSPSWCTPLSPKNATNADVAADGSPVREPLPLRKRAAVAPCMEEDKEKENLPRGSAADACAAVDENVDMSSEWSVVEAAVHAVEAALSPQRPAVSSISPSGSSPEGGKADGAGTQAVDADTAVTTPFSLPPNKTQVIIAIDNDECIGSWGECASRGSVWQCPPQVLS